MMKKQLTNPQKWILWGIPAIFILGSAVHFVYDFLKWPLAGMLVPVNESIWEHMKLSLLPVILWWGIYDLVYKTHYGIDGGKWFSGALTSLAVSMITMPLLYYFLRYGLGIEGLLPDIVNFLIAVVLGQLLGLHVFNRCKGLNQAAALALILFIVILFAVFTFSTPQLPIFADPVTGGYGIAK